MNDCICAIVLAAGKGTRMKSEKPKVLHKVFFVPMVHHVLDMLEDVPIKRIVAVVGHKQEMVKESLVQYDISFALQEKQLGTGHAVIVCEEQLEDFSGTVLILCGDTPLVRPETIRHMIAKHEKSDAVITVMTTELDDPTNYGRIITTVDGGVTGIVEEKDADTEQKKIREINAGIYCADKDFLFEALSGLDTNNKQGEMYLTDIVGIAVKSGHKVDRYSCNDPAEILGVNSRVELAEATRELQRRRNVELMESGVTMIMPETIAVEKSVLVGKDTEIFPNAYISGKTVIGKECTIGQSAIINDSVIEDGAAVPPFSILDSKKC